MISRTAGWGRLWALFAALGLVLSLAAAPAVEAVKHGPGAILAEAVHHAFDDEDGHSHGSPVGHHDSGDHDHVSAAVLSPPGAEFYAPSEPTLRPNGFVANGTIRDGPRRPPRLTVF
jgi:hypothetical protein